MAITDTQFKVGNPGRPRGSRNKATLHRAALAQCMGEDDELAIWRALVELAKTGDIAAARVCMEYRYGKPRQVHEIETDFGLQSVQFIVAPAPVEE